MNNQNFEMFSEYQNKALASMRALGDLNVSTAQWLINEQIALGNKVMQASISSYEQMTAAKTPEAVYKTATELAQMVADDVSGFVKSAAAQAVDTRESLKAVLDDATKLNTEYAEKAYNAGVEAVKAAPVAAAPAKASKKAA